MLVLGCCDCSGELFHLLLELYLSQLLVDLITSELLLLFLHLIDSGLQLLDLVISLLKLAFVKDGSVEVREALCIIEPEARLGAHVRLSLHVDRIVLCGQT